ncbi:MAG: hypothetical protein ACT4NU_03655 [Chromatiales bacterium]
MEQVASNFDPAQDLRREINALYGLLQFSVERRYPAEIVVGLRQMLHRREIVVAGLGKHNTDAQGRWQPLDAA